MKKTLRGVLGRVSALVAISAVPPLAAATSEGAAPKSHTLFMGADLSVAQAGQFYHVRDVSGGSFVIEVKGRPEFVAMDRFLGPPVNLRVDPALKLSRISATLNNLKGERAYTAGNNPRMQLSIQQAETAMALSDKAAMAEVKALDLESGSSGQATLSHLQTADSLNTATPWTWRPAGGAPLTQGQQAQIVNQARSAADAAQRTVIAMSSSDRFQKRLEDELAKELYDAMEVNFEVGSAQPLNNPFVVVITRFHEKNAKPGMTQNWIYAKSLNPIGDEPVKVHVLQGGFPRGFVLEEFQVHLYNQGLEVATNVSPKRVPLTLDEAMLYLSMDYQRLHQGETLPAKVALTSPPSDFQGWLAKGGGKEPLWVKVTKEGHIAAAFLDDECERPVTDPKVLELLGDIRCAPALERGQPVEGKLRLKLTDLPRAL